MSEQQSKDSKTPQQLGKQYEKEFSERYNLSQVPNSGAGKFYKMDSEGKSVLYSLKWQLSTKKSFSVKTSDLEELDNSVRGAAGVGPDYVGALGFSLEDEDYICLRMSDFVRLFTEQPDIFQASKSETKKQRARIPSLLRRNEES